MRFTRSIAPLVLSASFSCLPAPAQHATVVGVITISSDASSGTVPLSNGSTIYSGESISTAKGGHLQLRVGAVQLALAPSSAARIFRSEEQVIVQLKSGSLVYSAKILSAPLTIFADDIKFAPVISQRAAGQVELLSLCTVSAYVSQGSLEVTSTNGSRTVREGQRYAASAEFGVAFEAVPMPSGTDIPPDWSDPLFHADHQHVSCDGSTRKPAKKMPLIEKIVMGAAGVATAVVVIKAVESPDQP